MIAAAAAAAAIGYALVTVYWRVPDGKKQSEVPFRNPFQFWTVIGFAILLGVTIVAGRALGETFGAAGAIVGAAIAGLFDVDAVTVSMARLAPGTLSPRNAALAILTAVATDTISKIAIGAALGRGMFALEIAGMAFACFVAGGVALWLTFSFVAA